MNPLNIHMPHASLRLERLIPVLILVVAGHNRCWCPRVFFLFKTKQNKTKTKLDGGWSQSLLVPSCGEKAGPCTSTANGLPSSPEHSPCFDNPKNDSHPL